MSTENSNDLKTNEDDKPDKGLPNIDFFIKADGKTLRAGFLPHVKISGPDLLTTLTLGVRLLVYEVADKLDLTTDEIWQHFLEAVDLVRDDRIDDIMEGFEE